ncbi:molybdate ABC transporter substrate-binding protein [Bacillus sp. FJAT-50079]|uniref:molybdate ABC transporter substrate-binding protein n=1 Tax=Bacillus sp. FJAT-50079 TaxID=2833577 RepID=UPI001BC90CC0|nr:molybdate ABC transporter substrate-binding protein [Bacillus sp. FJAT-50079]MBS4207140.1 molybdate ABC transporter substrate-binding protein [Bacillus sp. FJAT-50079]
MIKRVFFPLMLFVLILSGCSAKEQKQDVELTVSAAASLQDALNEITEIFVEKHPHIKINYNFGASGALQQQISQGAPVDLFFSAAEDKFDLLVEEGLIEKEKGIDLVGNEIVLVVPKEANKGIQQFEELKKADKISIGIPESVPAGKYAKQSLENLHIWSELEEKIVYAKDVRQVLTYVETGNVDAGIVYKTDALVSDKVEIIASADENTHTPIIYPVGVIKDSAHLQEAELFYEYLQSEEALQILEKYGFKGLVK